MRIARVSILGSLCLSACAAAQPAPPTPEYPKVEAPAPKTLSLSVAEAATKLALPCAKSEPAVDNGLDDDCDGRIDQKEAANTGLSVTLAHANDVDVKLVLKGPTTFTPVQSAGERVCDGSAPFALQHLDLAELAPGHYELTLVRGEACGKDKLQSVSAAMSIDGKVQGVYALVLKPAEGAQVAQLDVK